MADDRKEVAAPGGQKLARNSLLARHDRNGRRRAWGTTPVAIHVCIYPLGVDIEFDGAHNVRAQQRVDEPGDG
jgi:hypothetical protein